MTGRGPESSAGATRLCFIIDWIEITDSMDIGSIGEFRFRFELRSRTRGLLAEASVPEDGTVAISEDADRNHLGPLDLPLCTTPVVPGETLVLRATGEEVDRLSENDPLEPYERVFSGPPETWVGSYGPWDESAPAERDPENRGQWRMSYRIEVVSTTATTS